MSIPLAERLRPTTFHTIVGQDHLVGSDGVITKIIQNKRPLSILLWGPPGCGKTTIARLYAKSFEAEFVPFSATTGSISEIKQWIKEQQNRPLFNRQLIIFVDEIHRFNKAQQDAFLPHMENGSLTLIGATTENPSFSLNAALLSRFRVFTLEPLEKADLIHLIDRYEENTAPILLPKAKELLATNAHGDARHLINMLENIDMLHSGPPLDEKQLQELCQKLPPLYDKKGDKHYDLISALHKSVRGSDPNAALYWLSRMLIGGEDPIYICRRLIRMAIEDIGLADPKALEHTLSCTKTYERLGSPEGELALAQAVIYLALSPKSNRTYVAYKKAQEVAQSTTELPPPKTILNAPTKLMKDLGHAKGYLYDHDQKDAFSGQNYFPDALEPSTFYTPVKRGFERELEKRISYFKQLREKIAKSDSI